MSPLEKGALGKSATKPRRWFSTAALLHDFRHLDFAYLVNDARRCVLSGLTNIESNIHVRPEDPDGWAMEFLLVILQLRNFHQAKSTIHS